MVTALVLLSLVVAGSVSGQGDDAAALIVGGYHIPHGAVDGGYRRAEARSLKDSGLLF